MKGQIVSRIVGFNGFLQFIFCFENPLTSFNFTSVFRIKYLCYPKFTFIASKRGISPYACGLSLRTSVKQPLQACELGQQCAFACVGVAQRDDLCWDEAV